MYLEILANVIKECERFGYESHVINNNQLHVDLFWAKTKDESGFPYDIKFDLAIQLSNDYKLSFVVYNYVSKMRVESDYLISAIIQEPSDMSDFETIKYIIDNLMDSTL